jgi:hypothetical protein
VFATGHPAGLAGIFAYGGWWSIPAAIAVGLVLTASFHCGCWVLRSVSALRRARRGASPRQGVAILALGEIRRPWLSPLADGWSDRGPPR